MPIPENTKSYVKAKRSQKKTKAAAPKAATARTLDIEDSSSDESSSSDDFESFMEGGKMMVRKKIKKNKLVVASDDEKQEEDDEIQESMKNAEASMSKSFKKVT